MRHREKCAVLLAAVGAIALLMAAGVFWDDLVVQHYLQQFRRDPKFFLEVVDEPEGVVRSLLLDDFVRRPEGKRALLQLFEMEILDRLGDTSQEKGELVSLVVHLGRDHFGSQWRRLPNPGGEEGQLTQASIVPERRYVVLRKYLPVLSREPFRLIGQPNLRWTVSSRSWVDERNRAERAAGSPPVLPTELTSRVGGADNDVVCVARPVGEEVAAAMAAALGDKRSRYYAARTLGNLGETARPVLQEMERVLASSTGERSPGDIPPWMSQRHFRAALEKAIDKLRSARTKSPIQDEGSFR